jgi:hypothetical protein
MCADPFHARAESLLSGHLEMTSIEWEEKHGAFMSFKQWFLQ